MTTAADQPDPSPQSTRVSPKTANDAVASLLKWKTEKSKTEKPQLLEQDEFVYLVVTLNKIPQKNRTNAHRIRLPHPLIDTDEESPELCLIIDDRPKSGLTKEDAKMKIESENIPITKVLKLSKLKTDYKAFEEKRKLFDSYDMFFADRRVIPMLPRLIGKKFFVQKKIPLPVDLKHKNWKQQIEKGCGSAMFFVSTGTCSVVKVGKLSMERDEIVENVMATLNGVVEVLPSQWKYVRSLHLKLSESVSLPIYQCVPDLKLKIDGFEEESVVKEEKKKRKGKSDDAVKGKKKKKGRIHEVRNMDSNVSEVVDEDEIGHVEVTNEKKNKRKKETSVVDDDDAEEPNKKKKLAKGKLKEKSKGALQPEKKTKVTKQESGGGLKKKKSAVRQRVMPLRSYK
ncbi:putative ribosome biogenesis protein C8F11.04 [Raphanus sativus]|uniref:Ribosome biogenesis protein C8F11.04 n=1 Tax=Raphanus sativus TaxID=3726 RepID=A0A6J0NRG2_RAPSA|nr:putative ribosome biogenesis protein C8F11.04 [Raphanus sativus]